MTTRFGRTTPAESAAAALEWAARWGGNPRVEVTVLNHLTLRGNLEIVSVIEDARVPIRVRVAGAEVVSGSRTRFRRIPLGGTFSVGLITDIKEI